ncbi:acyltransferase family protein [Cellulophaga baltica]|uniref:acyltransferase family protein n=1 Tax=Cellulophaga baltica TaxID=76594 RepID=UPI0004214A28|nr:acyltransferase [Cellulophaga baltica]AIY12353.1 hypothetical protein M667_03490 [Cellulophaga baltica NN016038]
MKIRKFKRLKILDSIRGIAALLVFYHHIFKFNEILFFNYCNKVSFKILKFVSDLNQEAVLLFFIISGFSIGLSVFKKPLNSSRSINTYFYRRFKRILPIYWISIIIAFLTGYFLKILYLPDFSFINLLANLLFIQTSSSISDSWAVPYGLNGPLWSLSFEMFFYLIFPIAYYINKKYLFKINIYIKYLLLITLVIIGLIINKLIIFVPYFLFLAGFLTWIQGFIASKYYTHWQKNNVFFCLNLCLGFIIIILDKWIPSNTLLVIGKGMLLNGFFYLSMLFFEKRNLDRLQNIINKLFFKIGEGSYAIYALHYPFLLYFEMKQIPLLYQIMFVPPFIVACYFLEKKSINWKMRYLEINYLKVFELKSR